MFCQMPPNMQIDCMVQKILQSKIKQVFWEKNILDYTDGNGLHFIKFDFVIGLQDRTSRNQNFHSAEMFHLLVIICSF